MPCVFGIRKQYYILFQRDMHRCAASCCENETYSIQKVHSCIENCSISLRQAEKYIREEFERVQVNKYCHPI